MEGRETQSQEDALQWAQSENRLQSVFKRVLFLSACTASFSLSEPSILMEMIPDRSEPDPHVHACFDLTCSWSIIITLTDGTFFFFLHISKPLNNTETPTFHLLYSFFIFIFYKYTNMSKVKLAFPDNLWTALGERGKSSGTAFAWIIAILLQELLSIIFHTVVHLCPPWTVIIMIHAKYGVLGYV